MLCIWSGKDPEKTAGRGGMSLESSSATVLEERWRNFISHVSSCLSFCKRRHRLFMNEYGRFLHVFIDCTKIRHSPSLRTFLWPCLQQISTSVIRACSSASIECVALIIPANVSHKSSCTISNNATYFGWARHWVERAVKVQLDRHGWGREPCVWGKV